MNIKINSYVEVGDITEEAAIAAALEKVNSYDDINEATIGRDVVTKLYYIVPLLNKILVVVSESDRAALGVENVVLANTLITEYPFVKLPPIITDYTELIVRKGSFLNVEQIANAAQAIIEESASTALPDKIPVLKVINYNNQEPSQLVLPSIFGNNLFLSSDAVVVNNGNAAAGGDVLDSPFGVVDLDFGASEELNSFQSGNSYASDQFGSTIAVSADGLVCIVGAPGSDVNGTDAGIINTFKRMNIDSAWVLVNNFTPPGITPADMFGSSVALSGNGLVAIVGAPGADEKGAEAGKVFTLKRSGIDGNWAVTNTYMPEGLVAGDMFGKTAAISDDGCIAMVGSYNAVGTTNVAKAYTIRRDDVDSEWIPGDIKNIPIIPTYVYDTSLVNGDSKNGNTLTDPSASLEVIFDKIFPIDEFLPAKIMHAVANGVHFKVDYASEYDGKHFNVKIGGQIYRGAFAENEDYNTPVILNLLDITPNTYFGTTVALSGDGLNCIIGAYGDDTTIVNSGKVYTYTRANKVDLWIYKGVLETNTEDSSDYLGTGLSISGDGMTIMIGNYGDNTNGLNAGKVNTYERADVDSDWTLINSFQAETPLAGDYFGGAIAISRYGHVVLVGAPGNDNVANLAGMVYTFKQELTV